MENILVTGASGFQGGAVAEELNKAGFKVYGLSSNLSNPQRERIAAVAGNLSNVESLVQAFKGMDGVFFTLPLIFDKEQVLDYTRNFIKAAEKSTLKLIIFNSSMLVPEKALNVVPYDIKFEAEQLLRASGLPLIYFHPRIYFDNIPAPWSVPAIMNEGIFAYSINSNVKVSWLSLNDLGRFAASAFTKLELIGQTFELGGKAITCTEIAKALTNVVGREVNYLSVSPDDFEAGLKGAIGDQAAAAVADIYRYLEKVEDSFITSNEAHRILKVTPVSIGEWVKYIPWKSLNEQFIQEPTVN
ncbi:SDR family oxidoreductase [Xanthovirga aplysinae]|uniref:SDR family oxidoreductase n=1 Tax=Xanthovirga aplysinae TaxID=2529853 RepID=UPI0012BBA828|nr:NmrA family NAD(P)-binding protein [Xanthovirga aplysinae]MTI32462.1 NAD-dependent epimerase/dehydratase family protein [Xanthovirga aplysinae]